MKPFIIATAFSLVAGGALAQGVTETTTTTTTISPADQTEMRDFVVKEHRAAVPPPPGFVVTNGVALPESVDLYSFPPERHWNYEYTTIGNGCWSNRTPAGSLASSISLCAAAASRGSG